MLKHHAVEWFHLTQLLSDLQRFPSEYDDQRRANDCVLLANLVRNCKRIDLPISCVAAGRLLERLSVEAPPWEERAAALKEIENRITDELEHRLFLYVPSERVLYYEAVDLFGPDVRAIFPSIGYDLEEAGKCLALSRGTAAVFHLMRIMETLLKHLGKLLSIPYAPSWESYIKQITSKIAAKHRTKGVRWKRDEPFFMDILGDLQSVKIAWRNPTMHVRSKYTLEEAEDIFRAVRTFAQRLAEREKLRQVGRAKP
jgi:hypothetical protein